ncbi:DNA polymerase IV [Candidatus Bathyarchaeota archaeon]|nr:DNA polymerase IV [Candidatus Bathyarchaeota archaeon]
MQSRIVMLVDLDYFFAQCEERRNPSIKNKPVVVCVYSGRTKDSGAVSTANYIARKYGVKSGIPISLAKIKLKDTNAVFLPVDKKFYKKISDNIMQILRTFPDSFEQVSIDEAYLDVTLKTNVNYQKAKQLASFVKDEVLTQQQLTCSIGISPNKLVSKIAADIQKPNGLTIVKPDQVRKFLAALSVRRLIGVGKKTEKKFESLGVRTVGQLANFDVQQLIDIFGRKIGSYFHNASLGIDFEQVQERSDPDSLSRICTLKEDTKDLMVILKDAYKLCNEVHSRLFAKGLLYRSVSVYIVDSDLNVHNRSKTLEKPTNNLESFKKSVKELFEKFIAESEIEIRRVGVKLSNLTKKEERQKQITSFFSMSNN